ncbi:hypothetical protein [Saccharothrix obliqua]|uniref:hypothetical protein n=1 Tax=Saccharothrix obliqua TaxID=2861747 RepID=UPI001C5D3339|nr:hypothetical protein [Saccharothrix obliqua]MBW4718037.1 hypothetical protein [Saccharothrix obliqua]
MPVATLTPPSIAHVTAFRFVGDEAARSTTGRINVLHHASDRTSDTLAHNGLREVAPGIAAGSERMLTLIDKCLDPAMTKVVVRRSVEPTSRVDASSGSPIEYPTEIAASRSARPHRAVPGRFRGFAFEYQPYPSTPAWPRLLATDRHTADQLLDYSPVDLTDLDEDDQPIPTSTTGRSGSSTDTPLVAVGSGGARSWSSGWPRAGWARGRGGSE